MSVSIMVVDDEPDVAELFRQRFRREVREGQYVMLCVPNIRFDNIDGEGPRGSGVR
jgi:hypothetical protein